MKLLATAEIQLEAARSWLVISELVVWRELHVLGVKAAQTVQLMSILRAIVRVG